MTSSSTFLFVLFFFFVGLICLSSATTPKYVITGAGTGVVNSGTAHWLHFIPGTAGTMGHVYQDQSLPQSAAVVDQSLVSGAGYTLFAQAEVFNFMKLPVSSSGVWGTPTIYSPNANVAFSNPSPGSASFTYLGSTFTVTASASTFCSSTSTSGGLFTITDTLGLTKYAGMGIDEFFSHDITTSGTTSYVTSYDSGTKTFTVKAKGYGTNPPSSDVVYLAWILDNGGALYWCRVKIETTGYTLVDTLECWDLSDTTASYTLGAPSATVATVTDNGTGNMENTYTFTITTNGGNC